MDAPIRKRVTQVGSGAWSIYLPKKWIDSWEPKQQEGREVDLRNIGDSLLITPVISRTRFHAEVPCRASDVRTWLLSAYLRGYHDVGLTCCDGEFDNDCIAAARDFLRHLDERIEAKSTRQAIGFRLRADLPASVSSGNDLIHMMAVKVDEVLALAEDAVRSYRHDADRALHALRLLRDTHEEDVGRLFYQATRLVATLEIPMPSVSAYQLLGLVAADLHRVSEQCRRMGDAMMGEYGLSAADLDYPRSHLIERLNLPSVGPGPAQDFLRIASETFMEVRELLVEVAGAVLEPDITTMRKKSVEADQAVITLRRRIFTTAGSYWGAGGDAQQAMDALDASTYNTALVQILDHIRAVADTATMLLAAKEE